MSKVFNPTVKVQQEIDMLFNKWANDDEGLKSRDYIIKYASKSTKRYIEFQSRTLNQAEKEGKRI